jgi:hypothetical protein
MKIMERTRTQRQLESQRLTISSFFVRFERDAFDFCNAPQESELLVLDICRVDDRLPHTINELSERRRLIV